MKKTKVKNQHRVSDKAASQIAVWMLGVQSNFAKVMNKAFSKLSTKRRKIAVLFFCLIGGGLSIYYTCEAVIGSGKEDLVEKAGAVALPKSHHQNESQTGILVDEQTWNKIQAFKHYMDSLKINNNQEYRNILIGRPGLMDSIKMLEQIYYSQKIK